MTDPCKSFSVLPSQGRTFVQPRSYDRTFTLATAVSHLFYEQGGQTWLSSQLLIRPRDNKSSSWRDGNCAIPLMPRHIGKHLRLRSARGSGRCFSQSKYPHVTVVQRS